MYLVFVDLALISSMTTVFIILYGAWALFGIIALVWPIASIIQWKCGDREGFRCFYMAIFAIFSPLVGILDEFKRKKKPLFICLNRIFLYSMIALILLSSSIGMNHVNQNSLFDHLNNGTTYITDAGNNNNTDCENICDIDVDDDVESNCNVMKISSGNLLTWTYSNWGLFGFSLIQAFFVFWFRK